MDFRLILTRGLDNRIPDASLVVYTYHNGNMSSWRLNAITPNHRTDVPVVSCGVDLMNQGNVKSRVFRAHYRGAPDVVEIPIASVQSP